MQDLRFAIQNSDIYALFIAFRLNVSNSSEETSVPLDATPPELEFEFEDMDLYNDRPRHVTCGFSKCPSM